jgi:hypothetical protein
VGLLNRQVEGIAKVIWYKYCGVATWRGESKNEETRKNKEATARNKHHQNLFSKTSFIHLPLSVRDRLTFYSEASGGCR